MAGTWREVWKHNNNNLEAQRSWYVEITFAGL